MKNINFFSIIKYSSLALVIWALPSFISAYFNPVLGSALSYLSFILLLVFVLKEFKGPVLWLFITLGISYYIIAGFNRTGFTDIDYFTLIIKYLIVIICGAGLLRKTSLEELYYFLLIGAFSIIIHGVFFPLYNADFMGSYGRFSGFYLNPNAAGAVSLIGFALSFGIKKDKLKYLGQLIFTIAGFITFSRYFLAIWLITNFLSVIISRKNLFAPVLGMAGLLLILAFGSGLKLNTQRFGAIQSVFSDEKLNTEALQEDSRTATWASYKDVILNKPIFGNGFKKLQGNHFGLFAGVHNTYLLVIGEAGIFPFLIIVGIYIFFIIKGYKCYKTHPHFSLLALVLFTALLVTHNYFDRYLLLFISMYLYINFTEKYIDFHPPLNVNTTNIK